MVHEKYISIFSPQETWADNRELYKTAIAKNDNFICNKKHAAEMLLFYERFPPEKKHDRTIAQVIRADFIKNPSWSFKKRKSRYHDAVEKLTIPERRFYQLEHITEVDFGVIAKQVCNGAVLNYSQSNNFLDINYKNFAKGIITFVDIRLMPCSYEMPILFDVKNYLIIDGEIVKENYFIHLPVFDSDTHKFVNYHRNTDNQQKLLKLRISVNQQ